MTRYPAAATTINAADFELACWLALWRTPGIGPSNFFKILQNFPRLEKLFNTPTSQLKNGLPANLLNALLTPHSPEVTADLNWAEQPNNYIITWNDTRYPSLLKEIANPPPLLFVKGNVGLLNSPQIAIVGSRNPTPSGLEIASEFAHALSAVGLTITSGLALGIDAAAHKGALHTKNYTIALLGSGLECIYPPQNKQLAQQILDSAGALVSEFPPQTPPKAKHFPERNRLVSGLSLGVLVIEATLKSGSLITARLAGEQGREIFAIPGSIRNASSRGCHALIRQGAKLVETLQDILEELPAFLYTKDSTAAPIAAALNKKNLDADYQQLLECIGYEATDIDQLVIRSGLAITTLTSMLLILEVKGYITAFAGGYAKCDYRALP